MNIRKLLAEKSELPYAGVIALGAGASAVGSIAALSGGIAVSIVMAVSIGIACLAFMRLLARTRTLGASSAVLEDTGSGKKPISSDRLDQLTGLANENGLMAWFSETSSKLTGQGKGIIVLTADLADFESIERSRGKAISDSVLIEVAKRIASCAGNDGIASRTSGDEFAAVATVVPLNANEVAEELAGKLAEMLQRPVELPSGVVWIGGSVGAAAGLPSDSAKVLARSRTALKKASQVGRGHFIVDIL